MKIDKKRVELIKQGDERTIEYVYLTYYKLVKYTVYQIIKNNEDADDITQNVFVKVFRNIDKYDVNKNFGTWLISVAKNAAIDHLRAQKSDIEYRDDILYRSAKENEENGDVDTKIKQLLTAEEYTIVTYKIYFDFKFSDIARMLNLNLPVITGKYYRAITKLRKGLKKEDFYD